MTSGEGSDVTDDSGADDLGFHLIWNQFAHTASLRLIRSGQGSQGRVEACTIWEILVF